MQLIVFANSVFGIAFVFWILDNYRRSQLISQIYFTSTIAAVGFFVFFCHLFLSQTPKVFVLIIFITVFSVIGAKSALFHWRLRRVKLEFLLFLDRVLLSMKAGASFRSSAKQAMARATSVFVESFGQLLESVVFLQQSIHVQDEDIARSLTQLRLADQQAHGAIQILTQLRSDLRFQRELRQRAKQALSQTRLQAVILTILYIPTFVWVIYEHGWARFERMLMLSLTLFCLGIYALILFTRKRSWKV